MRHEQAKIESEQKQETREMPQIEESPEILKQQIMEQSEREAVSFKNEGQQRLSSLEQRAVSEGLIIDQVERGELVGLNQEVDIAKSELLTAVGETKSPKIGSHESNKELQDFSKRYSPLKRSEVASEIWRLRKEHRERKKQTEQQNVETQGKRSKINEEIESTKGKVERIERVIAGFEESVRDQKSKVWYKITNLFKKEKLDDEKMLEIAQDKLSTAKEEIQERFKLLDETQEVIMESSGLEDAKAELKNFYKEQSGIKSKFEEEKEQRDVKRISQEKGVVFLHGLPLEGLKAMFNTSMNNPGVKTTEIPEEEKLKVILGLEPTLSSSAIRKDEELDRINTMYPFGVILNGGQVLSAHNEDASTLAQHIYNRKTKNEIKDDEMFKSSSIQSNVSENVDAAMSGRKRKYEGSDKAGYNEIIVENPQVSGFYLNVDFTDESSTGQKMLEDAKEKVQHFCRQFNLPAYGFYKGKMHEMIDQNGEMAVDFSSLNKERSGWEIQAELPLEKVMDSGRPVSTQEKLEYANSVIENNPFAVETRHKESFDGFGYGKVFYDYIKRIQNGEKVTISDYAKDSVDGSPEVFLSSGNNLRVTKFIDNGGSSVWDRDGGMIREDGAIQNFGFYKLDSAYKVDKENQPNNLDTLLGGIRESIAEKKRILEKVGASEFNSMKVENIKSWQKEVDALLFFAYGVAEEAKKDGDNKAYAKAISIVQEFGSISGCEGFVKKRVGEDGKFQVLEEDIPSQVRKRMAELRGAQDNDPDLKESSHVETENIVSKDTSVTKEGFPIGMEEFKIAKHLGGSSGVMAAEYNGVMFAIKKSREGATAEESEQLHDQLVEEYVADKIYESMGFAVPEAALYQGGEYKASKFVNGKDLGQREYNPVAEEQLVKTLKKGFVLDCLLANWDVIGEGEDNIRIAEDGNVYRMDNGGAMRFRARGRLKGEAFGATVGELETLKRSKWFKDITNEEIKAQIDDIIANKEKILSILDSEEIASYHNKESLKKILSERLAYLEDYGRKLTEAGIKSTESQENEILDREVVEKRVRMARWIQKQLESGGINNGDDLVERAKETLTESGVVLTRREFEDKDMDYISNFISTALENKRKFDEERENLDKAA